MPFVHITTRLERKHEDLLYDLGGSSFPSFYFLDADGAVLARHDEPRPSVAGFRATLKRVREYRKKKAETKPDDKAGQLDLAILRCELGAIDMDTLDETIESLGVEPTPAQQAAIRGLRANASVMEMLTYLQRARWSDEAQAMAGEEFAALHEENAHPSAPHLKWPFWRLLADHAVRAKDQRTLERCIRELEAAQDGRRNAATVIADYTAKLAAMDGETNQKGNDRR